jgi:hypothetical protein
VNYDLEPWQWAALMRYARDAENFGEYVRFILYLSAVPSLLQLERHAYPGQPSTRAHHVVQPCCCTYMRWAALHEDGQGIYRTVVATGFQICAACPHHGHLAHREVLERLWSDPYLNGLLRDPYDMDDDERRR